VKHIRIRITGRVQGVGFRFSAVEAAYRHDIKGFVKNNPDQTVQIEAEGDDARLKRFVDWCRKGPPGAVVTNIEISEGTVSGFTGFGIER